MIKVSHIKTGTGRGACLTSVYGHFANECQNWKGEDKKREEVHLLQTKGDEPTLVLTMRRANSKSETSTPSSHGVNFKSRDKSFNKALKWLEQDNNKSQVIALCGMGGAGKTTMMEQLRMVANDKNMFDYIVPVVIGREPNIDSIQNDIEIRLTGNRPVEITVEERANGLCKKFKHILELKTEANNQKMFDYIVPVDIGRTPNMHSIQNDISIRLSGEGLVEANITERADHLREKFKEHLEVQKKRILVTLDDVWEKIELKEIGLTSPLPNGLKLLLTSRLSDTCKQIAVSACSTFEEVEIGVLEKVSKEDDLYKIGCQIIEKCGGLPLAIKIMGKTLHSPIEYIWNTTLRRLNSHIDDIVQEVIKISYEHIKDEDKEVLLLCGFFPADYDIQIEDLMCNAWGLNLFEGVSTLGDARDSTKACVHNLINAHLLINSYEQVGCVKMHDLVHAFVYAVSKSDRSCIINHGHVTQLSEEEKTRIEACKRISITCKGMSEFPQEFKYPNLPLLQLMNGDLSLKFPEDFYENMKKLQVIAYYDMESPLMISKSLHCSTNLKSLCLYRCKLMFDFSFVGDLAIRTTHTISNVGRWGYFLYLYIFLFSFLLVHKTWENVSWSGLTRTRNYEILLGGSCFRYLYDLNR
ncbi:hypothetical protein R6Q59_006902 [Mikania micrantha]